MSKILLIFVPCYNIKIFEMRKLIIALMLFVLSVSFASAQLEKSIKKGDYSSIIIVNAEMPAAYALLNDSLDSQAIVWSIPERTKLQLYSIPVSFASAAVTETGDTTVRDITSVLSASYDGVTYYTLSTKYFAITQADTVLLHQDVSTGTDATYLKVTNTCVEDSTTANLIGISIKLTDK
jgi:hypothetical protein